MNEEKDEEQSEEQLEEKRCWDLWWKLANDYQYYAQEYEFQTQNDQAVLYYYTMSIYCCMEALKYEMPQETYDMIYDYMVLRYLDLGREDSLIPGNLKSRASNIGSYLGNFCGK